MPLTEVVSLDREGGDEDSEWKKENIINNR